MVDKYSMWTAKSRFNRYLLFALFLLLSSGALTFIALLNNKEVMAADPVFTDVALDHPAYLVCRQLIKMGAIRPRKGMSLAPFDKITAAEWNHALQTIGANIGRVFPQSANFSTDREVSGHAMLQRVQKLADAPCFISPAARLQESRLAAFCMLERCLLDYIND